MSLQNNLGDILIYAVNTLVAVWLKDVNKHYQDSNVNCSH